jgi:hypothetical protein
MSETLDQLDGLQGLIPQLPQAHLSELFGEALQDAGTHAFALLSEIEKLERWKLSINLLRESWQDDERRETLDALRTLQIAGSQMATVENREQLSQVRTTATAAKQSIGIILRDGLRVWQHRIEVDIGSLGSLGSLLGEFADTRSLGGRMTSIKARGDGLKNQFPPTAAQVESYNALLEEANAVRVDLAAIGTGESIQRFLLALASETATLDMVDESVLRWIRDRRSDYRFRLSLQRSGIR